MAQYVICVDEGAEAGKFYNGLDKRHTKQMCSKLALEGKATKVSIAKLIEPENFWGRA